MIRTSASIGLIIGAFKPYTKGHHFLVETASKENDSVYVFISQKDRKRKGEFPILWEKMNIVWENYIKQILPPNVHLVFVENPATELYNFLLKEENEANNKLFNLYTDDHDKKRYCYQDHEIKKKFPIIYKNQRLKIKTFNRTNNINVSATKARQQLQFGNKDNFINYLPGPLQIYGQEIFNLLIS